MSVRLCNTINYCVACRVTGNHPCESSCSHLQNVLIDSSQLTPSVLKKEDLSMEEISRVSKVNSNKTVNSVCYNSLYPILYGCGLLELSSPQLGHLYDLIIDVCGSLKKKTLGAMCDHCHHPACQSWFIISNNNVEVFELLLKNSLNLNLQKTKVLNLLGHKTPLVDMLLEDLKVTECSMVMASGYSYVGTPLVPITNLNVNKLSVDVPSSVCEVRIRNGVSFTGCACFAKDVHFATQCGNPLVYDDPVTSQTENYDSLQIDESPLKSEWYDHCDEVLQISDGNQVQQFSQTSSESDITHKCGISNKLQFKDPSVKAKEMCTCVGPQLLCCPACSELVKGGHNRVQRLVHHVRQRHKRRAKYLITKIKGMYPMKPCPRCAENRFLDRRVKLAAQCSLVWS